MRVPARIYTSYEMLKDIFTDRSLEQLINMTTLPGIVKYALCMPDVHQGYGFPIGGVAAFDLDTGIISPGGIGYDINCGVRLLKSKITRKEIEPYLKPLLYRIFDSVPSGVGQGGGLKLSDTELDRVMEDGVPRMIKLGYGHKDDLEHIESKGRLSPADSSCVSLLAKKRGRTQVGTLGAGNHFIDIGYVESVIDKTMADDLGLFKDQITIMIHSGSRGLGHQIATDYIRMMKGAMKKYKLTFPDWELAGAPLASPEGQQYFKAMACGANFAWANRQMMTYQIRQVWKKTIGPAEGNLNLVYDVAHNIAKIENYKIDGQVNKFLLHRKGATRAFPGQPVLIPGTMGTASYVMMGTNKAMQESFGSSCHGAGRRMSRGQALRSFRGNEVMEGLRQHGILIKSGSWRGLAEEAPEVYKDIESVVNVMVKAGLAAKIIRLKPLAVIKG